MSRRTVFFVSDQTGVTAETMGHSLMTQFEGVEFRAVTLPFVSSIDKAQEVVRRIDRAAGEDGLRPIVFSTLVQDELRDIVMRRRRTVPGLLRRLRRSARARARGALDAPRRTCARHRRPGRLHHAHQRHQLRARQRRWRRRRLRACRRGADRCLARRQDADLRVHGAAVRGVRRQLPAHRGGSRERQSCRRGSSRIATSCTRSPSSPSGCSRSARAPPRQPLRLARPGAVRAARGGGAVSRATGCPRSIPPSARSRRSPAGSSTLPESSGVCALRIAAARRSHEICKRCGVARGDESRTNRLAKQASCAIVGTC